MNDLAVYGPEELKEDDAGYLEKQQTFSFSISITNRLPYYRSWFGCYLLFFL